MPCIMTFDVCSDKIYDVSMSKTSDSGVGICKSELLIAIIRYVGTWDNLIVVSH